MKRICDTHALLFDALTPERLSARARAEIEAGERAAELACADISLWEIAMLIARGRIRVAAPSDRFLRALLDARAIEVLPILPEIAALAQSPRFAHGDPADRLIAATAIHHKALLITRDQALHAVEGVRSVW